MDWALSQKCKNRVKEIVGGGGTSATFCQSFIQFFLQSCFLFLERCIGTVWWDTVMSRGLDEWLTPIAVIMMIILLMTTMMIKTTLKQLWCNDDDGRDHEDKPMTFFKQVKRTLNFKLEICLSQNLAGLGATSFPESSRETSRRGAC